MPALAPAFDVPAPFSLPLELPAAPEVVPPAPEIAGDPRLIYSSNEDAAAKIAGVLDKPATRDELLAYCQERGSLFTIERFQHGFRDAVERVISQAADSRA